MDSFFYICCSSTKGSVWRCSVEDVLRQKGVWYRHSFRCRLLGPEGCAGACVMLTPLWQNQLHSTSLQQMILPQFHSHHTPYGPPGQICVAELPISSGKVVARNTMFHIVFLEFLLFINEIGKGRLLPMVATCP